MNTLKTLDPKLRQNLIVLFGVGLFFWSALSAVLAILPLYIRDAGANEQQIGIVMGAFAVGLLLSRAWIGQLSDQRGYRLVLLLGVVICLLTCVAYPWVTTVPGLFILRMFQGLSAAAITTAYSALVVALVPLKLRGELLGYMTLCNPLGLALGPVIAGLLYEALGFNPVFLFASALSLAGILCAWSVWELARSPGRVIPAPSFGQVLGSPQVAIPSFVMLVAGLIFGLISAFIPLFIAAEGLALNIGAFYAAVAVASFISRLLVGRASDRLGRGLFITLSLVAYVLSMLILWGTPGVTSFLIAGFLEGLAAGTLIPAVIALIADRTQPHERATSLSICLGGFDLGLALAGPVLGYVAVYAGFRTVFGIAAGLSVLALGVFLIFGDRSLAPSLRFALGRGADGYAIKGGE